MHPSFVVIRIQSDGFHKSSDVQVETAVFREQTVYEHFSIVRTRCQEIAVVIHRNLVHGYRMRS